MEINGISWVSIIKLTSRLVSDGWVEQKIPGYRYHFQEFQLELDTLGTSTKNFGIGSVGAKLQPCEVRCFLEEIMRLLVK